MASFNEAFLFCMAHEDPTLSGRVTEDTGGKTRFGLAARFNPMLEVWGFFTKPPEQALEIAKSIYADKYWIWAPVQNQDIANKLFDMGVNMGLGTAVKLLQAALSKHGFTVSEDGKLGPETLAETNRCPAVVLLPALREVSRERYLAIVEKNPEDSKYLKAWLSRADA